MTRARIDAMVMRHQAMTQMKWTIPGIVSPNRDKIKIMTNSARNTYESNCDDVHSTVRAQNEVYEGLSADNKNVEDTDAGQASV